MQEIVSQNTGMLQPLRNNILSSSTPLLCPLARTSLSKRICSTIRLFARKMCNETSASIPSPPVAKKVKHEMELFGDVRVDNYYWLRDDKRSAPEVLSYLREENDYTDRVMSGLFDLLFLVFYSFSYLKRILIFPIHWKKCICFKN